MNILNPYLDLYLELKDQPAEFQLSVRKKLIWAYAWAIPSHEAIQALREMSPLIEIGAGTGYWTWLLRQAGENVIALDKNPEAPPHWTLVERGNEESVQAHGDRTLFLCWPSYQEPMAVKALSNYTGSHVVYVGEWKGRTADDEFHRLLTDSFDLEREIPIPTWPGYSDRLFFFKRRSSALQ